mgnify:FL=1
MRIAINGFGRIGRSLTRVLQQHREVELVAINDLASAQNMAHLLKYDTTHRLFDGNLSVEGEELTINGQKTLLYHHKNPEDLPWQSLDLDIIIESTGLFRTAASVAPHLRRAKRVILTAPPKDDTKTLVLGINDDVLLAQDRVVSNASCTTNSAAPLVKIIEDLCGIEHAYITTVHSYTTDQQLQDGPHQDFRRGRAAAESIVPTTTGAAKAITKVFPNLEGRIGGAGIRVPVPDGSLTDITFSVRQVVAIEAINEAFLKASEVGKLKGILGYTKDPIVSRDVIGSPYSCLFDQELTSALGHMVKVVGWYDNEMGYANRLADLILLIGKNFA